MLNGDVGDPASLMAGFDPRLKVVSLAVFSILVALCHQWPALVSSGILALVLVALSGISLMETLRRLVPVNTMVLFLWVFLPFSVKGQGIYVLGPLTASREGVELALLITMKANVMMLMFISFAATTPVMTAGQALDRLGLPYKLVHLFFFTYRYIHVIYSEYNTLRTAMTVRGFVPKTSVHTYRSYAYLVGMLLVRSSDRAERVYRAMICRGFNGRFYSLREFSMNRKDGVMFSVICLWMLATGWMEWMKMGF